MKPSKIYIKIFVSFILILIITEILIFGLFMINPGRHLRSVLERYAAANVMMVKEVIEDKVRSAPNLELSLNENLKKFMGDMEQLLEAHVWLQDAGGQVLVKSFRGKPPREHVELKAGREKDFGHFKLYHGFKRSSALYAVIPIRHGGESATLHVLFSRAGPSHLEEGFALGLGLIGLVIAVLVIPVSRFISQPINELRHSAQRIAEGDLSRRAAVKRKDEIGKLGGAFNQMADRLEKMIRGGKELMAHVSHELRTPLARIRIAEEIVRERLEQGKYTGLGRYLDDIREDIEELDALVGRILTLSKLDLKDRTSSFQPLDPVELMNTILNRLKPAVDQKSLQLTIDLSFDPPFAGDQDALQAAFTNILENAVKYSPTGGRVSVVMHPVDKAMEVLVTNTAEKIPGPDLEKIFEPFHRLGTKAEAKAEAGFGLGLAIVKKTVEAHGGTVEASNTAEGFRISTRLPRNPGEARA